MGNILDCAYLSESISSIATPPNPMIEKMQQGGRFLRPALMGLTAQELYVRLSDDNSNLQWKTTKSWTGEEKGQVDLTDEDVIIKSSGTQGILFIQGVSKVTLLEINAEETAVRDEWIVALHDLRMRWKQEPGSKPASGVTAEGFSNKDEYFARRAKEIEERKKENEEKKKKYAAGGMKFTAQIMASSKS